jgi:hypothetical protein
VQRRRLPYLAELAGAKRPLHIPVWAASLAAGEVATRWMTQARGSSSAKLRALPWRPAWPSWRQGFRRLFEPLSSAASSAPRAA